MLASSGEGREGEGEGIKKEGERKSGRERKRREGEQGKGGGRVFICLLVQFFLLTANSQYSTPRF